jgi:hypothetical protein
MGKRSLADRTAVREGMIRRLYRGSVATVLEGQLAQAHSASQRSQITISWEAPVGTVLNYHVRPEC